MTRNAYYVTTAIAYPNGDPHIGHAYEMIATDAIARWRRLEGREVFFLTGTDEHGIKMVQTAAPLGLTPRELADRNSARFRELAAALDEVAEDGLLTAGISPHAPYTVPAQQIAAAVELAGRKRRPWTMHLAETREEMRFLAGDAQALPAFLADLAARHAVTPPQCSPIELLRRTCAGARGRSRSSSPPPGNRPPSMRYPRTVPMPPCRRGPGRR